MKNQQEKTPFENLGKMVRKSVVVKLLTILVLMMLLMIPMTYISLLIHERESLHQSVVHEVSSKWANDQLVYGPVLTIPFNKKVQEDGLIEVVRQEAHILPTLFSVEGHMDPTSLYRGIYEVVVYNSNLSIEGNFADLEEQLGQIIDNEILWNEAFLTIHVSDLRGIKDQMVVEWNGKVKSVTPGTQIPGLVSSGITVANIFDTPPTSTSFEFSFDLQLQGSHYLGFVPLGRETLVKVTSEWEDPSFSGSFLPDFRDVNDVGFTARYKILELNRNYPQFWIGNQNTENIKGSSFGIELLRPVDDYRKTTRSAKYALLFISLTFLTFFLAEVFNKKELHPFQYALIGLALCLFYILLLSLSEWINFNMAYLISATSIITMIGLYARSIMGRAKQVIVLVLILGLVYAFVFFTLQLQAYALLIGSVGLTIILAVTMYITRRIDWFDLSLMSESKDL